MIRYINKSLNNMREDNHKEEKLENGNLDTGKMLYEFHHNRLLNKESIISFILLAGGFLGICQWFSSVDVYNKNFFDNGYLVFFYNTSRIIFAFFIVWIIYATGYFFSRAALSLSAREKLSLPERLLLGFGIGLGCWHVLMLSLGILNLYYHSIVLGLSLAILTASAIHFQQTMKEIGGIVSTKFNGRSNPFLSLFIILTLGTALFWLLLVRGLYPGGNHDYYTHYFYYYLNVIQHHGLTPNDVWYHYYYSKGAGLFFLGILLTDPLAPSIITFCCVMMAALAMMDMLNRIAAHSLWPMFAVLLYLLYNLIALHGDGGEFQKLHEITSALVIMMLWGSCKYDHSSPLIQKNILIGLTAVTIAASILTQAIGIFFGVFYGAQAGIALITKNYKRMQVYIFLTIVAGCAVSGIFLLNYLVTGLPTDQALHVMWQYANVDRLHQLGWLPNILLGAWIRDNYSITAVPWGLSSLYQLASYTRVDVFWPAVVSLVIPFTYFLWHKYTKSTPQLLSITPDICAARQTIFLNIGLALILFSVLALLLGHSQVNSFARFSSFFLPTLALFVAICWSWLIPGNAVSHIYNACVKIFIPIVLTATVVNSWNNWLDQVWPVTANAIRFMSGKYSIAEAYAHEPTGYLFGGINPGVWAAMQHVPAGSRVWSTNVASYCMVAGCQIESVVSFKLSARMNEILNGTPLQAKKILQEEKLNYFLFSDEYPLRDILPYSQLFNPANITKHLTVAWTDGKTYLLTWSTPNSAKMDPIFLSAYQKHLKEDDHVWFKFKDAIPEMNRFMHELEALPHPWKPIKFPWQKTAKAAGKSSSAT